MTALLDAAFRALGSAASAREIEVVARTLRASGDAETLSLFALSGEEPESFDRAACVAVTEVAVEAGAGGFVGLDLYAQVLRPGWSPFPRSGDANERNDV